MTFWSLKKYAQQKVLQFLNYLPDLDVNNPIFTSTDRS